MKSLFNRLAQVLAPHWKYLCYVMRHKRYVFLGCLRLRVSLWQALVHDWSKFTPAEWFPYVDFFYGPKPPATSATGYMHKTGQNDAFDRAWLHHQHANPHHWQHWLLRQDDGQLKALEMPRRYVDEMVADWYGAGMAQGKPDIKGWYQANYDRYILHPATQARVEELLERL